VSILTNSKDLSILVEKIKQVIDSSNFATAPIQFTTSFKETDVLKKCIGKIFAGREYSIYPQEEVLFNITKAIEPLTEENFPLVVIDCGAAAMRFFCFANKDRPCFSSFEYSGGFSIVWSLWEAICEDKISKEDLIIDDLVRLYLLIEKLGWGMFELLMEGQEVSSKIRSFISLQF